MKLITLLIFIYLIQNSLSSNFCSFKEKSSNNLTDLYIVVENETIREIEFPSFILTKTIYQKSLPKVNISTICIPLENETTKPTFNNDETSVYNYSCRVISTRYIHMLFKSPIRVTTNQKNLFRECSCTSGNESYGQYITGIEIKIKGYSNQFIYINAMSYHYNFGQCHLKTIYSEKPLQYNDTFTQLLILEEPSEDHYLDWILGSIALLLCGLILFCCLFYWCKSISRRSQYTSI